jgi:hypothetical protein
VRDFLTPNDYWHPKSLKRLRKKNGDPGGKPAQPTAT